MHDEAGKKSRAGPADHVRWLSSVSLQHSKGIQRATASYRGGVLSVTYDYRPVDTLTKLPCASAYGRAACRGSHRSDSARANNGDWSRGAGCTHWEAIFVVITCLA